MSKTYKVESLRDGVVLQSATYKTLREAKAKGEQWHAYDVKVDCYMKLYVVVTCVQNGFDIYSLTKRTMSRYWRRENLTKLVDINIKWPV